MRCEEHISQSGSSPVWLPGLSLSPIKEPSNNLPNEETNCVAVLPSTMILLDRASLASPVANCRFRRLHFTTRTLMELAFQIPSLPPADFCKRFKRHGTLNLFAALEVATGAVHMQTTQQKRRVEFLEFMDQVMAQVPLGKEIHVILDNYCIHKKNDTWLSAHPNVFFHYTPTSASWLNQVEVWFGIMSRKALRGASFKNVDELRLAIEAFVAAYSKNAKPFVWRKREVKESQLRDNIVNLCN